MAAKPAIDAVTFKPVVNQFQIPVMACGPDGEPCCDPCTAWMQCLKRTPFEAYINGGINFSAWLQCVSMSAKYLLKPNNIGAFSGGSDGSDGTAEFDGKFLFLTADEKLTLGDCGSRGVTTLCQDAWPDDGFGSGGLFESVLVTHTLAEGRTIFSVNGVEQVKRVTLALQVICTLNDALEKCVKFRLVYSFQWEGYSCFAVGVPALDTFGCAGWGPGLSVCDPEFVEKAEGFWGEDGLPGASAAGCCPLAESACLPLDTLTWEDLAGIDLPAIPPPTWELIDPLDPDQGWKIADDNVGSGGCVGALGMMRTMQWWHSAGLEGEPCVPDPCPDCPEIACGTELHGGVHGPFSQGCNYPGLGVPVWVPLANLPGSADDCGSVWIAPPVTINGTVTLRAVADSCHPPGDCKLCVDPVNPLLARPLVLTDDDTSDIRFLVSGSGCTKSLTAFYPTCIEVDEVWWSDGQTGETITYTIKNVGDDGISLEENVVMYLKDVRGCIFCWSRLVTCGCCPGTSGSLVATSIGVNVFELCATTNGTPDDGPCAGQATVIRWTGTDVTPGSGTLGNGDCVEVEVTGDNPSIEWWVEDGEGCEGEHVTTPLYAVTCVCCNKPINAMRLTIDGWGTFDAEACIACDELNGTYELRPQSTASTCIWTYQTSLGHGPTITCREHIDPEDPETPPYTVGVEIFVTIYCIGDGKLLALAYINMSEGAAVYYKEISCPGCDASNPGDCSGLEGDLELDALGVYGTAPSVGGCNPLPATVSLEIEFGE